MRSNHPYHLMAAITVAVALSFAAGVVSASLNPSAAEATAENLLADIVKTAPFEYFPSGYQNQGKEIEPLPPQF